ncbi:MAG TPA: DUF3383 family protein [Methanosarcina sp.]|nr:DUF3383 family protein [Methanosarcina sp.]
MALSVSDLINVVVNVSPTAAANRGFGVMLIIGDSTVISAAERIRTYSNLTGVLADFNNTTPEYAAAQLYFAQIPTPSTIMIGRQDTTETPLQAIQACVAKSSAWYAAIFSSTTMPSTADNVAIGSYIEALTPARVFGYVTNDTAAVTTGDTTSLPHQLKVLNLSRTIGQYSSSAAHAIAAFFGRALNVDFTANKSTITMMYKQEVLVAAETLTESQAAQAKLNNLNTYVNYDNGTAIVQYGTVANGRFFDEVHGLDWLQNAIQTAVFNLFYQSTKKIPQTDAGVGQVISTIAGVLDQAVANGLVAAGQWNSDGFGALNRGDYLKSGYYVYVAPISTQSQADREARICPPIQIAVKMAGAIHTVAITVNVNR